MTPKRITKTLRGVKSCRDQARADYWMLDREHIEGRFPYTFDAQYLVGGKVMRVYQENERGTLLGLVIEEEKPRDWFMNNHPEKQQHLIIPVCPNPEPELNGWMYAYHCHIPIHRVRRVA